MLKIGLDVMINFTFKLSWENSPIFRTKVVFGYCICSIRRHGYYLIISLRNFVRLLFESGC